MKDSLPAARPGLNIRVIDEEVVIVDIDSGDVHQLNPTASFIWQQCDGKTTFEQIVSSVVAHYEISQAQAGQDVASVVDDLQKLNLLIV